MKKHLFPFLLTAVTTFATASMLNPIGRFDTGVFDDSAAEIPAYDATSKKLFVVNGGDKAVDVLDLTDPTQPSKLGQLDLSLIDQDAKAANSVAAYNGLIAVAVENDDKQANGWIALYDAVTLNLIKALPAGALPDMVAFSKDGSLILSANEGEPNDDYSKDPVGSMTLIKMADTSAVQIGFTSFNDSLASLKAKGVRISKEGATVAEDLEPEYVTFSEDGTKAWVTLQENNALALVDLSAEKVTDLLPLGLKDFSKPGMGLDPIDDGNIKIANYPLKGMFMPDAITSMQFGGKTFLLTANEGDGREYIAEHDEVTTEAACDSLGFEWDDDECLEEAWIDEGKLSKLDLDSTAFTTEELALIDELPSKLLVVNTEGDTDGDDLVEEIVMYGARSFSIWSEEGKLVWDSGDQFEQATAKAVPDFFNASNDGNELEDRSRKKGPEAEGVITAKIGDNTYAFIGLERVGGIMVYDVTVPTAPQMIEYFTDRDFTVDGDSAMTTTQLGPEGLEFIPADKSPNGKDLLIVSYEVSGNSVIYEITAPAGAEHKFYTMQNPKALGEGLFYFGENDSSLTDIPMQEGGWSDLLKDPKEAFTYWAINDRGINVSHKPGDRNDKVFYQPEYHHKLIRFKTKGDVMILDRQFEITSLQNTTTTGLPNPILPTGEEALKGNPLVALIDTTDVVAPDSAGYDFEGLVFGKDSMLYMSDEYGPFIVQIDPTQMKITKQYYPGQGLPLVLKSRRANRGMEGLSVTPSGMLMGIMQAPLYNVNTEGVKASDPKNKAHLLRLVQLNPENGETAEYAYMVDAKGGNRKITDVKIGAMTAINESEFIVIEHGKDKDGRYWIDLYKITLDSTATNISVAGEKGMLIDNKTLEEVSYDVEEFLTHITPVKKELLMGDIMGKTAWPHTKPEGITIIDSMTVAINNDNDYGMSDIDHDGIPHVLPADERLSQLMVLTLPKAINYEAIATGYGELPEVSNIIDQQIVIKDDMLNVEMPSTLTLFNAEGSQVFKAHLDVGAYDLANLSGLNRGLVFGLLENAEGKSVIQVNLK